MQWDVIANRFVIITEISGDVAVQRLYIFGLRLPRSKIFFQNPLHLTLREGLD